MLISSLEQMESIVKKNRALHWEGWDVIQSYPSPTAWMSKYGSFFRGKWYMNRKFALTEQGWHIPEKMVKRNGFK